MNLFQKRIHGVLLILTIYLATFLSSFLPQASAAGQRLGGMNLGGYCQSIGQSGSSLSGSTWVCSPSNSAINMSAACQWQYPGQNATAVQDVSGNPYSWSCYAGTATPTPTQTVSPTTSLNPTVTPTPTWTRPIATPTPRITATPTPTPGTSHYLALGDSFAFGFHLAQYNQETANHTYSAASFNDGYDADFFKYLQGVLSGINEVNYSCPGETSGSFVNGGCAFHSSTSTLHSNYPAAQPQLQAAVNYLQQNPTSVVTIDIGVNDAINLSDTCQAQSNPVSCYNQRTSGVLSAEKQNYDTVLNALQKAAPNARIILIKAPDPVYYDGSDALVSGVNQIVDNEASSRGLREADTYSIFNSSNVCSLTNFCSSPSDFHPNTAGYSAMANVIRSVSGY